MGCFFILSVNHDLHMAKGKKSKQSNPYNLYPDGLTPRGAWGRLVKKDGRKPNATKNLFGER